MVAIADERVAEAITAAAERGIAQLDVARTELDRLVATYAPFAARGVPIIGLVENMSGYVCPHCGEISDPFGSGGAEAAAREVDGIVRIDAELLEDYVRYSLLLRASFRF